MPGGTWFFAPLFFLAARHFSRLSKHAAREKRRRSGPDLGRLFSTHPPADERIRRLRALAQTVRGPAFAEADGAPRSRLVR